MSSAAVGVEPRIIDLVPVAASRKSLERAGLGVEDLGLIALSEAYPVQALAARQELGLRHAITNVNGGAIALGHPPGCSGERTLPTLVHDKRHRAGSHPRPDYGLAALCVGAGQGEATVVELCGGSFR